MLPKNATENCSRATGSVLCPLHRPKIQRCFPRTVEAQPPSLACDENPKERAVYVWQQKNQRYDNLPMAKTDTSLLEAALVGYQAELTRITAAIADLRQRPGERADADVARGIWQGAKEEASDLCGREGEDCGGSAKAVGEGEEELAPPLT